MQGESRLKHTEIPRAKLLSKRHLEESPLLSLRYHKKTQTARLGNVFVAGRAGNGARMVRTEWSFPRPVDGFPMVDTSISWQLFLFSRENRKGKQVNLKSLTSCNKETGRLTVANKCNGYRRSS